MKITKLNRQIKNTEMVNIFIDDKYYTSIGEDNLIDLNLFVGKEVNQEELDNIKKGSVNSKLRNYCLNLLTRRPYTEYEIKQKLEFYCKKHNLFTSTEEAEQKQSTFNEIIENLKTLNLINDSNYAKLFIESKLSLSKYSKRQIKLKLTQKGIDKEIIEKELEQIIDPNYEDEVIKKLALKKYKTIRKGNDYEKTQKTLSYLLSKGFDYTKSRDAIKNINNFEVEE
jgi:regulatory protein